MTTTQSLKRTTVAVRIILISLTLALAIAVVKDIHWIQQTVVVINWMVVSVGAPSIVILYITKRAELKISRETFFRNGWKIPLVIIPTIALLLIADYWVTAAAYALFFAVSSATTIHSRTITEQVAAGNVC